MTLHCLETAGFKKRFSFYFVSELFYHKTNDVSGAETLSSILANH